MKEKQRSWLIMGGLMLFIAVVNAISVPASQRILTFLGYLLLFAIIVLGVGWYQSQPTKRKSQVNLILAGVVVVAVVAGVIWVVNQARSASDFQSSYGDTNVDLYIIWIILAVLLAFVAFRYLMSVLRSWFNVMQPESVIQLTTQWLQWLPNNPFLLKQRAHAHQQTRNFDAAFADLNQAIEHRPNDVNLLGQRMWLNFQRHNYEAMLADAEFIAGKFPNISNMTTHGLALQKSGRYGEALEAYKRAENAGSVDPALVAILHIHRASLHRELREMEAANYELKQINPDRFIPPQIDQVKFDLAIAYGYLELFQEQLPIAERHFNEAAQLAANKAHLPADKPQIMAGLAIIQYLMDHKDEAQQGWQALVEKHPDYADSQWVITELALPDHLGEVVVKLAEG